MRKITFLLCIALASPVVALEDSPANREIEARRYIATMPAEVLFADAADAMSKNLNPEDRFDFKRIILEHVNYSALDAAVLEALTRHMTADELTAMADFYEQPVAKSAMRKLGLYMADVMPIIEAEMMSAVGEFRKLKAAENRSKPDLPAEE